jgi:hypothetical protein
MAVEYPYTEQDGMGAEMTAYGLLSDKTRDKVQK